MSAFDRNIAKLDSETLANPLASRRTLSWILLLFVGSGCAALIYEVVWLQLLRLVIGLTTDIASMSARG